MQSEAGSADSERAIDFRDERPPSSSEALDAYRSLARMPCFGRFERVPYRVYFDEVQLQHADWNITSQLATEFFAAKHSISFRIAAPTTKSSTGCFQKAQNVSFGYVALLHAGVYYCFGFVELRVDKPVTSLGITPTVWLAQPFIRAAKYLLGEAEVDAFVTDFFENEFEKVNAAKLAAVAAFIQRHAGDA